jgi:tRNA A-37 threonylcarbamoyl transferase component Bud32
MTTMVLCPNPACGRASHLGKDPLGRIFRCPRCLAKLPAGHTNAGTSGWMTTLGPLPTKYPLPPLQSEIPLVEMSSSWDSRHLLTPARLSGLVLVSTPPRGCSPECKSRELPTGSFDSYSDDSWDVKLPIAPSLVESGEVYVGPFLHEANSKTDACSHHALSMLKGEDETSRSEYRLQAALRGCSSPSDCTRLGRYEIIDILGKGHHATVFRAFDPVLQREVALKLPRHDVTLTTRAMERFLAEARALARLRHPRIVPVYEAGRVGDRHYIAMALIEGHSLAELIATDKIPHQTSVEIVVALAEALAYAHNLGIVHRDVKPANIRMDRQGSVYLMDFGIAYCPDSGEVPTPVGTILGTPAYVAPEQARGGQTDVLPASDQYSLGAVLYELLCGRPPFCGPPSFVLFHAIHRDPPPPRATNPRVPRPLSAICQKAMAKRPEDRYSSCQDLADDLHRWLGGRTPLACRRRWLRILH